jgi:glycerophosphoryl diester phosphodiesterase
VFFLNHDDRTRVDGQTRFLHTMTVAEIDAVLGDRVRYEDVLALIANAGRKAHLDFKFTSPAQVYSDPARTFEVAAVEIARTFLDDDSFIVTTAEDVSVRAVRDWSDAKGVSILVGLSIGRHRLTGMSRRQKIAWRAGEMFPGRRIHRSGANLVVAQRHLARVRLLGWAHRHNLPVLVWTVDNHKEMRRLLADARVWMVTSNFPEVGLDLRKRLAQSTISNQALPSRAHA